jgi:uroporphyrinogen-III decarboxylase
LGSADEISREVNKTLDEGSKNPGFILSTACSIAPAVKMENILLLREITDKWTRTKN